MDKTEYSQPEVDSEICMDCKYCLTPAASVPCNTCMHCYPGYKQSNFEED